MKKPACTAFIMKDLNMSVQFLKGVGPERARILKKIGIETVGDLITYFPFRHEDRAHLKLFAQITPGEEATVLAVVSEHKITFTRGGRPLLKILLEDGSGKATMVCFNQLYLKDSLPPGTSVVLHGKFESIFRDLQITNFTYEKLAGEEDDLIHTKRIVPIYQVTSKLNLRFLRTLIKRALDSYLSYLRETLSETILREYNLMLYQQAVYNIHFPSTREKGEDARRRLIFEEFFFWELAMALRRRQVKVINKNRKYQLRKNLLTAFKEKLPFDFTSAQKRVIREIFNDLMSPKPMNRLLQGDVGSGKTVVALAALLLVVENGYQAAVMAPTEILAEQHYLTLRQMLEGLQVKVELATGKMGQKKKREVYQRIVRGESQIIIGTHALIEQGVKFSNLALAVIDEQHKFGVMQRARLRKKGENLDILVMTATPIPRTLTLTVYGDLDVSIIDQLPPGRRKILTQRLSEEEAYQMVIDGARKGQQAYIVYPIINESDKLELRAAVKMAERLMATVFKDLRVGLLHGQMKSDEKEQVMMKFLNREFDILITTTIIEVGIDVANACLMVIEHSERFGLATLHQLRGRVGRGTEQSLCILLGQTKTEEAKKRAQIMLETNDGFRIAEEDLRLRGGGEFFGTQQHGLPEFKIGNIVFDHRELELARQAAFHLISKDPVLTLPENGVIKQKFREKFKEKFGLASVG
ncbi:ATP-dependent DNA helicase RecG [subsurface metagenome]|nr:ATP-dependent DNA helicase RecG [Bacillota bacterium]